MINSQFPRGRSRLFVIVYFGRAAIQSKRYQISLTENVKRAIKIHAYRKSSFLGFGLLSLKSNARQHDLPKSAMVMADMYHSEAESSAEAENFPNCSISSSGE